MVLRIFFVQQKAGMKTESAPTSQPRTPIGDNRALADTIIEHTLPRAHSIDPQLEVKKNHLDSSINIKVKE